MIADRVIGHKNSIMLGAVLMTLGHFTMAFENDLIFFLSLGLLIIGNGFFKPNISSLVGGLYEEGNPKRDGGFTIFYMGINIGAFLAPLLCGWLGDSYGWHYGFGAAGIGMLAGLIVFWRGAVTNVYGNQGNQPKEMQEKKYVGLNIKNIVYILAFLSAPLFGFLVLQNDFIVQLGFAQPPLMSFLLDALLVLVVIYITYICIKSDKVTRERLFVIAILTLFITVFWACFELSGSAITLFAEENVNLIGLSASQTNSINPFFIMVFAIPFSLMWVKLDKTKKNPRTPVKFAFGIIQLGVGFVLLAISSRFMDTAGMVPMLFLVLGYLFMTTGELFISPVGLSKVTELAPIKLVSFMMGVWFLSSAFAHHIAGLISKLTVSGSEEKTGFLQTLAVNITGEVPSGSSSQVINLFNYTSVFAQVAIVAFGFGIIALILTPVIKKWMHGIH